MQELGSNWTPVSGSSDLPLKAARAVTLPHHDVAIWRSESGRAMAWENRCPHRGMRLSFGQVRGNRLLCRYHGWGFDEAGQCQNIPASPNAEVPPTACTKTYACRESGGLIWVNVSETGSAKDDVQDIDNNMMFCKSIFVDGTLEDLLTRLKCARFLPLGAENGELTWSVANLTISTLQITASGQGGDILTIAIHQTSESRCGLHITTISSGDEAKDAQRKLHYGKWAVRLRHEFSNPSAGLDGFVILTEAEGAGA